MMVYEQKLDFLSSGVLRIELLDCFEQLLQTLDSFCIVIRQDNLPVWVSHTEAELGDVLNMRLKAIQLYRALWYEGSEDGRETLTCPGIVGASPETLIAAQACNIAKDRFKAAILALKTLGRIEAKAVMTDLHCRQQSVALAMRRMGAARLNLKQAYRHIPLLEECPLKIGFTWSRQGRVIQRTSLDEARLLLEQRVETPQVILERQKLATLGNDEVLARVRSVCPHLRANLVFADNDGFGVRRRLMQTPLPLLVPLLPGQPLPEFVRVASEPPISLRLRRADVRIEDEPFLPSMRIHRYRLPYR
jgi:hypothetical protein